jgi:hypothetical protein
MQILEPRRRVTRAIAKRNRAAKADSPFSVPSPQWSRNRERLENFRFWMNVFISSSTGVLWARIFAGQVLLLPSSFTKRSAIGDQSLLKVEHGFEQIVRCGQADNGGTLPLQRRPRVAPRLCFAFEPAKLLGDGRGAMAGSLGNGFGIMILSERAQLHLQLENDSLRLLRAALGEALRGQAWECRA